MFYLGIYLCLFDSHTYQLIFDNEETWYMTGNYNAIVMNDSSLMDH